MCLHVVPPQSASGKSSLRKCVVAVEKDCIRAPSCSKITSWDSSDKLVKSRRQEPRAVLLCCPLLQHSFSEPEESTEASDKAGVETKERRQGAETARGSGRQLRAQLHGEWSW